MSELIRMRQRIKAIETIKKITHAMRLVAMSMHSRLRTKKSSLEEYQQELTKLFSRITASSPLIIASRLNPIPSATPKTLAILVGSQKGLCGTFNAIIYTFAQRQLASLSQQPIDLITVGKKAHEYAAVSYGSLIMSFDTFNQTTLSTIAATITHHILTAPTIYDSVLIFSNYPKTFLLQKPRVTNVIPFVMPSTTTQQTEEYIWEQDQADILNQIINAMMYAHIQEVLFQSLIAEQAARFLAMDNSTRNATNLLDMMRLNYNKMRQAKITRELTDLIASF